MKLKKTVKFNLNNLKSVLLIYYGILCACILAGSIFVAVNADGSGKIGGLEMTSTVFLFVMGLSSFRSELNLFLQNGISRKTGFFSFCISSAIIVGIMALLESIAFSLIGKTTHFETAFHQIYGDAGARNIIATILATFVWSFCLYYTAHMIGYFIAILYYRMGKILKLVVSIGVPVLVLMVLPILDETVFHGAIAKAFSNALKRMVEVNGLINQLTIWAVVCLSITFVFGLFSYLLSKRAVIKSC